MPQASQVLSSVLLALTTACIGTAEAAPSTKLSDFAFEVKDSTGYYYSAWVVDKLTTFKVAPKCMTKMIDRNQSAVHFASFYAADIAAFAESVTGNDWAEIESQNNNDRENNKNLIEPMIAKFKSNYSMTVVVEGDDCDASSGSMWLKYWTHIASTIKEHKPASGRAFVTLTVTSKVKDVSVSVDKAGTTFNITAPRDIEVSGWDERIAKPFRKVAK